MPRVQMVSTNLVVPAARAVHSACRLPFFYPGAVRRVACVVATCCVTTGDRARGVRKCEHIYVPPPVRGKLGLSGQHQIAENSTCLQHVGCKASWPVVYLKDSGRGYDVSPRKLSVGTWNQSAERKISRG